MNSKLSGCVIDFSPSLQLKLKEQIGSGSFSYVYTCTDPRYVVKIINSTDPKSLISYENERTAFLALPKHENIIHCPAFRDNIILKDIKYCCLVLENCPRGSLISMIVDKNMTFQENQILQIFLDVLLGLHQMHSNSQPIAHRDLKCENVLLAEDGRFKLIDFGSISMQSIPVVNAENRDSIQDDIEKNTTPTVRAPEQCDLFSGFPINEKVDIWALGCLLYILCFQKQPFETKLSTINCQYFLNDTSKYSENILNLFPLLFQADPTQRPSTASLLDYFEQNFYSFSRPLEKPIDRVQTVFQPKEREYKSIFADIPEDYDLERHSRYKNLVRQPITKRKNKTKELVLAALEKNKNSLDEKSLERMVIKSWQKPEKIKEIYSVIHQIAVQKQENTQMSLKILMLVHKYLIMCPSTAFLQELPKRISYPNDILMFVNQRWKLLFENDISSTGDKECNAYFSTFLSEYSGLLNHKVILHTQYSNTFEGNFSFDPLLLKNTEHDDSLINDSILWDILNYLKRILQFSKIIMLTNDMKEIQCKIASIVFEEGFNLISSLSHITAGLKSIASQISTLDDLVVENNFQRFETQFEICYKDFRELLENKDFDFVKNLAFELPASITQQIKTILNATREKEQQSPLIGEVDANESIDCFKIPSSFSTYRDIKSLDEIEPESGNKHIKSNALKPSLDQENQPKCIIEHLPLKQKDPNQGTERQKKKIFEHIPEAANKEQKSHDLFMMMFNDKKPETSSALKDKTNIIDKTPNAIWENIFHVQSSDRQNKIERFTENPNFKMPASLKTYSQDISTKFSEYLIPYHELVLNQSETRKNLFHASWREKGIVLRKFELAHLLMDHKEEFERKLLALTQISQHSNLANFLGISLNNSEIYVIYEQFTGSSLFEWLDSNKDVVLSWNQKAKIALGYASALHHLHSCNFSFFNEPLKPLRPLMTCPAEYDNQDFVVKFENLDIEISKEQNHQTRKELMRTFGLMAPETFVCKSSGVKADVFTFSILLWKVLTREEPYPKLKTPIDIMKYVSIQKKRPELARIPNSCPKMLINLMTRCWAHDPQIRPSFAEIIEELEQFLRNYTAEFSA